MPAVHSCPSCDKTVKVPDGAEGKKMKCPGCQSVLLVTEDGLELASKQAVQSAPAKPARKAAPPPDDEDEDEDEEPEERPVKAKKRRPVDEDDEDEPRPKKRRAEEDDEDEEEDDRPRRKKKRKKSGGIPAWVWIAGGGGVAAIALVLVLVLFVFGGGNVANLDKVKVGMTEQEVYDLVGKPHHVEMGMSVWSNPKLSRAEAEKPGSDQKVKEALLVVFQNGKAARVEYKKRN